MPVMGFAFASASSMGTLPINMECTEKMGVSKEVTSFVLPLGATINMDGTAIYQGVCAIFIAQVFGIDLSIGQQLTIVMTAVLASIGTAGVPGSGMIMLAMVLQSVGLPVEGVALVAGRGPHPGHDAHHGERHRRRGRGHLRRRHAEARRRPQGSQSREGRGIARHSSKVVSADWIKVATPRRWLRNRHRATKHKRGPRPFGEGLVHGEGLIRRASG